MLTHLPGTTLPLPSEYSPNLFSALEPVFALSPSGLMLSQITELTGLGASTIQNWVKRGWVSNPINKRYGELHVARILLINLLRPAMQLENIAILLQRINGSVDDRSDDIIPDTELYNILSSLLMRLEHQDSLRPEAIQSLIADELKDYSEPVKGAKERLQQAMTVMSLNILAARLMSMADTVFQEMKG